MTLAVAGARKVNGITIAVVNLKLMWDVIPKAAMPRAARSRRPEGSNCWRYSGESSYPRDAQRSSSEF